MIKLLLERDDINVNSKDDRDWTPLYLAVYRGDRTILNLLMERDDIDEDSKVEAMELLERRKQ